MLRTPAALQQQIFNKRAGKKPAPTHRKRNRGKQFLPRRAVTQEEVFAQMEKRHKKRLASIRSHYARQGVDLLE